MTLVSLRDNVGFATIIQSKKTFFFYSGIVYCTICKGYTKLVCAYCEGYFEVKFFIQLQVEFFIKVHKYYIEEDKTDVPVQKEKVSGEQEVAPLLEL